MVYTDCNVYRLSYYPIALCFKTGSSVLGPSINGHVFIGSEVRLIKAFDRLGRPKTIQSINRHKKQDEYSDNLIRHFQAHFFC